MTMILNAVMIASNFVMFLNFQSKLYALATYVPMVTCIISMVLECAEKRTTRRVSLVLFVLAGGGIAALAVQAGTQFSGTGYWFVAFEFAVMVLYALVSYGDVFRKEKQQ